MKFKPTPSNARAAERTGANPAAVSRRARAGATGGFTLVEVLAALLFMAIVIPVTLEGFQVASRAGEYGQRKLIAARIAESKLEELVATGQWRQSSPYGTVTEGYRQYRWQMRMEPWTEGTLTLVTVGVYFPVQGRDYEVHLSTLVDPSLQ